VFTDGQTEGRKEGRRKASQYISPFTPFTWRI